MNEGIIAVSLLVLLFTSLLTRQICDSGESELAKRLNLFVTPVIIPFALLFVFIVVERVRELGN